MTSEWAILALGLLLGVRHAFDVDHLVAVSTIVSEYRNPLKAIWIGVSWGLGHTTTLFLAGGLLLLLNLQMPERVALWFEFAVGIMLVALGVQTLISVRRRKVHVHVHDSVAQPHQHFHTHEATSGHGHSHEAHSPRLSQVMLEGAIPGEHRSAAPASALKPFFRLKSYLVGTVHGLAGSAALMLLVLASIRSVWHGLTYILIFGLGTVLSMGAISIFISLPFSVSGRLPRLNAIIQVIAGTFSIIFGVFLMYQIGIAEGLFAER